MMPNRSRITKKLPSILVGLALLGGATASAQEPPSEPTPDDGSGMPAPPPDGELPTAEAEAEARMMQPPPEEDPVPEEPAEEPASFDWDKGFVFKKSGDKGEFKTLITFRMESLYDSSIKKDDTGDGRTYAGRFSLERGRISLDGYAFTKKLGYKFQTDFGKGFLTLKDFYFDAEVAPKAWLRTGQWKRPYSRQQINSSGRLEMTSRAITDKAFRGSRDIGIAIHNGYESSPDGVEWVVGVFNGTGDKASFSGGVVDPDEMTVSGGAFTNVPKSFMPAFVARVGFNKGGIKGYSEADLEGGPLRFAVAASVYGETDLDRDSKRTHQAEADFILKANGLSASTAVYWLTNDVEGADMTTQLGFHVQVGKVIGEKTRRIEPVARYAMVKPDGTKPLHEILLGLNWFPYGHNCKLLFGVGTQFDAEADQDPFDNTIIQLGFGAGMF